MRLVVEVPDTQLEKFRAACAVEKRTQADVIRTAIDAYVNAVASRRKSQKEKDH